MLEETSKSGESVTLAGRREGQPRKIWAPVDVTLGMKADTSAVHLEKALRPIEVARGMETEEREVQRLNAIGLTDVTTGREMVVIEEQLEKAESPIESARGMSTDVREEQPLNANLPIEVTAGMEADIRSVHPLKALSGMEITLAGKESVVVLKQSYSGHVSCEIVKAEDADTMSGLREEQWRKA